ncbi:MAG: hypothetical protein H7A21_07000 [Spirochaetales bacterium]|nr:hypothetical protein [Leptospiraceae bacterium]MCP5481160.1 hypothetical protein [Spirochaetales bacterium]MCP5486984.1 hypothetical protein [Spirochaetales bacterium]
MQDSRSPRTLLRLCLLAGQFTIVFIILLGIANRELFHFALRPWLPELADSIHSTGCTKAEGVLLGLFVCLNAIAIGAFWLLHRIRPLRNFAAYGLYLSIPLLTFWGYTNFLWAGRVPFDSCYECDDFIGLFYTLPVWFSSLVLCTILCFGWARYFGHPERDWWERLGASLACHICALNAISFFDLYRVLK